MLLMLSYVTFKAKKRYRSLIASLSVTFYPIYFYPVYFYSVFLRLLPPAFSFIVNLKNLKSCFCPIIDQIL
jgi:hypothetical protein